MLLQTCQRPFCCRLADHVLVSAHTGQLSLLDAEKGVIAWSLDTGTPLLSSSAVDSSKLAVVPGADGHLYAHEDSSSGKRSLTVCQLSMHTTTQRCAGS